MEGDDAVLGLEDPKLQSNIDDLIPTEKPPQKLEGM